MLRFWESGKKGTPVLLFIHGWTCTHQTMQPLIDYFEQDFWCIAPDLNGHGESDAQHTGYSIDDQCNLLYGSLGDALSQMVVIGHSMGGQIALELAARGQARAAVLLDPAPIIAHAKAKAWADDMSVQLRKVNIPSMMGAFARNQFVGPAENDMVDRLVKTMQATDPEVAKLAWDGIAAYDGPAALAKLDRPVLVISADKPLNDMRAMAKASPWIETAQTAGSGHMQQLEVPDQLNLMIRRFLSLQPTDSH